MKRNFEEITADWIEFKRSLVKESSLATYRFIIKKYLLPYFKGRVDISEQLVQRYISDCIAKGLGVKIVKDSLVVLRMIMKYGARRRLCKAADWELEFPANSHRNQIEVLTIDEQRKLMDFTRSNHTPMSFGIHVCLTTGLRIGEICGLKWGDIDMRKRTLTVHRTIERIMSEDVQGRKTKLVVNTPKTVGSFRVVPLTRETVMMARGIMSRNDKDCYVLTNDSVPTEPRVYRSYFRSVTDMLGIRRVKFHCLRHSFSTRCIECGCDYKTVSTLLGHADISTTLNMYVHPDMAQKKRCISKMFNMLNRKR